MSCCLQGEKSNQHATACAITAITATSPSCHVFCKPKRAKRDASTDEECEESKDGVPFMLLADKRHDGEYSSCRSKTKNPLATQAIDASLKAKKRPGCYRHQWVLRYLLWCRHAHIHATGSDSIEHSPALSWQELLAQPGKNCCHTRFADSKEINPDGVPARIGQFASFAQGSFASALRLCSSLFLPCTKSLPVPGKPLSPRGMI